MKVFSAATCTVTQPVASPPAVAAVKVYLVVTWGATSIEPDVASFPTCGSMYTVSASEVSHLRVTFSPGVILSLFTEKELMCGQGLFCAMGEVVFSIWGLVRG